MKHGKFPRKLGRDAAHRWAMLRTMVTQLIEHERITTTVAKAKELRRVADKVVTYAKKGTLTARRQAGAIVRTDSMMQKLFTEFADRYKDRKGGYTRVLPVGQRQRDAAKMAFIEYVDREGELRPARPPEGLGISFAAKELVHKQLLERRSNSGRDSGGRGGEGGGGLEGGAAGGVGVPPEGEGAATSSQA